MPKITVVKSNDFTVLKNRLFRDGRLSFKAKGLLSTMLSLPEGWDYSVSGLMRMAKDGKDSVTSGLNELEENGYLIRSQAKDETGKFIGYDYRVYEVPLSEIRSSDYPMAENPSSDNPLLINTNKLNTDLQNTEEIKNLSLKESNKRKPSGKTANRDMDEILTAFISDRFRSLKDTSNLIEITNAFIEHRTNIKKKLSPTALKLNLEKAYKLASGDYQRTCELIANAVANGWQGIYEDNSHRASQPQRIGTGINPGLRFSNEECLESMKTEEVPF